MRFEKEVSSRLKSQPTSSPCLKPGASVSLFGESREFTTKKTFSLPLIVALYRFSNFVNNRHFSYQ